MKIWNVAYTDLNDGTKHHNRFESDKEAYEWILDIKDKDILPETLGVWSERLQCFRCVERL